MLPPKMLCRVAVLALFAMLEVLEDVIPISGEVTDNAEIAATPAIIQGCVKGIKKEPKAEIKVSEKKHTLSIDKPSGSAETRPPSKVCNLKAPGLLKRAGCNDVTRYTDTTTLYRIAKKAWQGGR